MTDNNEKSIHSSVEQRNKARRKIKFMVFKMHVGIPLIGTSLIILSLVLISIYSNADNIITKFLYYMCAFSIIWLVAGLINYSKFTEKLPPKEKE